MSRWRCWSYCKCSSFIYDPCPKIFYINQIYKQVKHCDVTSWLFLTNVWLLEWKSFFCSTCRHSTCSVRKIFQDKQIVSWIIFESSLKAEYKTPPTPPHSRRRYPIWPFDVHPNRTVLPSPIRSSLWKSDACKVLYIKYFNIVWDMGMVSYVG